MMHIENLLLPPKLQASNFILRPLRKSDIYDIFEYARLEDVGPMCGWEPYECLEDAQPWLDKAVEEGLHLALEMDGKEIGHIGLTVNGPKNDGLEDYMHAKRISPGAVLSKAYWGRGIMTEALKLVIDWLFEETDVDVVVARYFDFNLRSARMQEKCGLHKVAEITEFSKVWDGDIRVIVNVLTRDEWAVKRNEHAAEAIEEKLINE